MKGTRESRDLSLVIVGAYPEDPTIIRNGVEAVVVYLVEGLRKVPGIQIRVISTTDGGRSERTVERDGVIIYYLRSTRRFRNITLDAINKARVRRKIAALRPDVVHVHCTTTFPYIGFQKPLHPTVTTVHGVIFEEVKYETAPLDWLRRPARTQLERFVLRRAEDLIAVSEYVKHAIQPLTRARITVIENPVEERYFDIGEHSWGCAVTSDQGARVLFAGTIMQRKNLLDLVRAVEMARNELPQVELRIVGGVQHQHCYDALQRYVSEHRLQNNVRFLGRLSERDLLAEYERCTLVASASHEESAGMVFQQAMAAGKPVLGTRVGGVPFIVKHEETGLLVNPGNVDQLAEGLRLILGNLALRTRMGEAGRTAALVRFRPASAAQRTLAVYEQMIRRSAMEARE